MVFVSSTPVQVAAGTAQRLRVTNSGPAEVYLSPAGGRIPPGGSETFLAERDRPTVARTSSGSAEVTVEVLLSFPGVPAPAMPDPDPGVPGGNGLGAVVLSGAASAGRAPLATSEAAASWVDVATQAELDAAFATLPGTYGRLVGPNTWTGTQDFAGATVTGIGTVNLGNASGDATGATEGTGGKKVTLGSPVTIGVGQAFTCGFVAQVAAPASMRLRGQSNVYAAPVPWGAGDVAVPAAQVVYMAGVSGALPATFTPANFDGMNAYSDHGVWFRRSA